MIWRSHLVCKYPSSAFQTIDPTLNSNQGSLFTEENEQYWAMLLVHAANESQFPDRYLLT